jgi:hypothetical protein
MVDLNRRESLSRSNLRSISLANSHEIRYSKVLLEQDSMLPQHLDSWVYDTHQSYTHSMCTRLKPKPFQDLCRLIRDFVTHSSCTNSHNVRSIVVSGPTADRIISDGVGGGLAHSPDIRPLFHLLSEVVIAKDRIGSSMPELHLGSLARISRIGVADEVTPLRGSLDVCTLCALGTPGAGPLEACEAMRGEGKSESLYTSC